jgi:hypothetical protein
MNKRLGIWRMGFRIAGIIWVVCIALILISLASMFLIAMFAVGWEQYWGYIAR